MPAAPSPVEVVGPQPADDAATPPSDVAPPPPVLPNAPPPDALDQLAVPPPDAPSSGRGMLIAAGALGVVGGIIRIATTISVIREIRREQPGVVAVAVNGAVFHSPFIATALGLAGGGMARRGRLDAHEELFEGKAATRKRRQALGWGLFGGGVALWTVTRVAGVMACRSEACVGRVWETGYYLSLGGTVPGVLMGSYASGFNGYERRFGHLADVGVAPIAHRNAWGLALSGRF